MGSETLYFLLSEYLEITVVNYFCETAIWSNTYHNLCQAQDDDIRTFAAGNCIEKLEKQKHILN